ncbi:response regulator [Bacillus sp. FJAT-50079]|uniref:response regulator n=1 Tax=Bacillus sp. FJAT-50079 TaxID=2833577 RepID=UPI001BCA2E93|nr:response regulator [Bacillus sp. FJAT-50079]MBS4207996.1 response regulator [Bacillus sp. FJAT-50079]
MKQFHVLIVDDEIHAIRGVEAGVQWKKLNISTIHTAYNLKQAQKVFQNHRVDLLISDIDMPKGTGIDLLKWVREYYSETETIFLSAHADFSYAKQALQLNSFNYLLKPVDYSELEEVIQEALQKITKDKQLNKVGESYFQLQKTHENIMIERFWLNLVNQAIPSTKDKVREYLDINKINIDDSIYYLPILIHVQRWKAGLTVEEEKMMEAALKNAIQEEIAKNDREAASIELGSGYMLIILPRSGNNHMNRCQNFILKFRQYFDCDLCCYVGKQVRIYELLEMIQSLKDLDRDNVTMINQVIELKSEKRGQSTIPQFPVTEWLELMKIGSKEKLIVEMNDYIESLRCKGPVLTSQSLQLFYQDFLQMLFYVLQMKGIQANQVFSKNILTANTEKIFTSINSLQEWLNLIIDVAMDQLHKSHESNSVVDKVKQFIKENIGVQKLSREDIANYVYLNPDYLTRVFKKETGLSLSDYLQQERIETAKELLLHTNMSVSDIALESGYSSFSYFSTIFKKVTRHSPVEFRRVYSGE